jgi:hypothetical protein
VGPRRLIGLALVGWLAFAGPASAASPFANWAAIIVAGDWRAHSGAPSEVFDNARRDLATAFVRAGFSPNNIRQFSVHEARPGRPAKSKPANIADGLDELTHKASGGCLIYFTSHGTPDGVLVNDDIWPPSMLADLVDHTCGKRPTVVVVSACFSGVFAPTVGGPNRMVLTAARRDRASFGCGQEDRYTYFDACILSELPNAHDFGALGAAAQACVARREKALDADPPSEPQMDIGPVLRPLLPLYAFEKPH